MKNKKIEKIDNNLKIYEEFPQLLVERDQDTIKARNNWGNLPIHYAALYAQLRVVKYLLERDPDTIKEKNYEGWLPIHNAVFGDNLEIVKYLVEKAPDTIKEKNQDGHTPIGMTQQYYRPEVAKYLKNFENKANSYIKESVMCCDEIDKIPYLPSAKDDPNRNR